MPGVTDQEYLLKQQYNDASNLNARKSIHARFSTNPYGWFRWVFDQFDLPDPCRVIELGCGPGDLWRWNLPRIPQCWEVILSDFSEGMAAQAQQKLAGARAFTFEVIDAQSIPYPDQHFEAVIANHMLYHVPDRPKALAEIRRVLKPGGRLFATTIGEKHLQELLSLPYRFDPQHAVDQLMVSSEFSLESGPEQLQSFFTEVKVQRYPDSLHVTEAAPLVDYIYSTFKLGGGEDRRAAFQAFVEGEIRKNGGALEITKDSGMLTARKT